MALTRTSIGVHLLVCLFGIGSWIDINGVWVEMPIMVQHLPEGWNLGSYLVIIVQLANIGPLAVTLVTVFRPSKMKESPVVYAILMIGGVACLLLAFLWKRTSMVSGVEHSVALLVLQFFLALVDCTSSVVFLPFMSVFKQEYMTTYFIGEGLSGLIPSLLALVQGAGAVRCVNQTPAVVVGNVSFLDDQFVTNASYKTIPEFLPPRFPVRTFFIFLFLMMVACCSAFALLNHHPFCRSEKVLRNKRKNGLLAKQTNGVTPRLLSTSRVEQNGSTAPLPEEIGLCTTSLIEYEGPQEAEESTGDPLGCPTQDLHLSRYMYFYYLLLTAWMNGLTNAVLPSIQSFSCLPYGLGPYHLAVILSSIANPLACSIAIVLPTRANSSITAISFTGTALSAYLITLAVFSPSPFLKGEQAGEIIMISVWVLSILSLSYAKVSIATIFRIEGKKALLWCGAVTQIGSALGAILMFILVNVTGLFESAPMCS